MNKENALNKLSEEVQPTTAEEDVVRRSYELVQELGFKNIESLKEVKAIMHLRALLTSLFQWQKNHPAYAQHYADQVLREATLVDGKILFNPYPSCPNCTTEVPLDIQKITDWFTGATEEYWQNTVDSKYS